MKKISLSLFLLLLGIQSFCQYVDEFEFTGSESPTNLVIKAGFGIPSGDFADNNLNSENSGLAKVGLMLEAEITHLLSKSVYLSFMGRIQFNGIDEDEITDFYRSLVPSNVNVFFDSDPWVSRSVMAGFGTLTPIDPHATFMTRFMAGATFATSAAFEARLTNGMTTVVEEQEGENGSAFGFLIGAGLKLDLNSKTVLIISGDYLATKPEFENVNFRAFVNNAQVANENFSFEQQIQLINFSIGMAFAL